MKNKGVIKFGKKQVDISYNPFDGSGHTDYSGFGVHGKAKTAKSRESRRENRQDARNITRGMEY
jgi:hypothetical protein